MHKGLPKHTVQVVQFQRPNEMMDRRHVQDLDMLSMYGQDDLHQSVFAAGDTLTQLESVYHFAHEVLGYLYI
jgi:hypothetical protein